MSKLKIKNGNTWEEVPAGGVGVPSGGTKDQYLKKSSSTDYAVEWASFPSVETLSITLNTSGWTVNQTKCFVNGKYVFAPFYVTGTPSKNKTIATGLPVPKLIGGSVPIASSSGSSPSIIAVNTSGTMYISSNGTGTLISGVFCYETE